MGKDGECSAGSWCYKLLGGVLILYPLRVTFNVVETHKNMYLETEIQRGPDTKFQKQD